MSHVDEGTLHAYLDGELPPAEARGVEGHVAECAGCCNRLEEERALIARAGELLGLAAPPDHATPPFRAGDLKPPALLWSQVRLPLAWAATVMLALGIGMYLGSGAVTGRREEAVTDRPADVAVRAPAAARPMADTAVAAPPTVEPRRRQRARSTQAPTPTGVAALERENAARVDTVASVAALQAERAAPAAGAVAVSQGVPPAAPPAPASATTPLSIDSARILLGQDPVALPNVPIRAMRREPAIGATIIVLEQALDSSTVIELRERVAAASGLVAVARDAAEERDALRERAAAKRVQRLADSIAVSPRAQGKVVPERSQAVVQSGKLWVEISGPLTADSLGKLLDKVKPIRP